MLFNLTVISNFNCKLFLLEYLNIVITDIVVNILAIL